MSLSIGTTLKQLRTKEDLTQVELSKRSGVSDTIISRIENGKIADPRLSTLVRLAEGLGISPSKFIDRATPDESSSGSVLSVLRKHKQELRTEFHVKTIGLFGSTARGGGTPESDVDILVEYEDGHRDIFNHSRLEEYLEENLDRPVDLVLDSDEARNTHPRIHENIEEDLICV
jgi:predicted nucleotidyltransferase/DNA-binding Xre family transcriptional regulator